jgi:hypothetical protein
LKKNEIEDFFKEGKTVFMPMEWYKLIIPYEEKDIKEWRENRQLAKYGL